MGGSNEKQSSTIPLNDDFDGLNNIIAIKIEGSIANGSSTAFSNNNEERSQDTALRDDKTAAKCLSHLYLSKEFSDIDLIFENDSSTIFPAHKVVLSMRSKVFADELNSSYGPITVLLIGVKPEIMQVVLRFIYTDNTELSSNIVISCLYAAKGFHLHGLEQKCWDFLEKTIDANNVCLRYNDAITYKLKHLEETCLSFIIANATNVLFTPGFLELPQASLLNVLKQAEMAADELDIFKAAMKWAEKNCETNSIPITGENMRNQLDEALFEIRFATIPIQELVNVVAPSEILTKEEMTILYRFHAIKKQAALEKNFCKLERTRGPIIIDLGQYDISAFDHCGKQKNYALEIECEFYDMTRDESVSSENQVEYNRNSKSLKLKSISGTFVESVRKIVVSNSILNDYEVVGNNITFQTPIEMCNGEIIQFIPGKPVAVKNLNGLSLECFKINQNGDVFSLVQFPATTETITFLK
ncbi:BTB/POZ domain-containing protein 19-like [Ruditapes philippinarum]|uniref:BTB/POZ domain-containing protein 19-like n=1 Tax=Ruditapes philippinarum TaxID=129788 RepID=UPI00295BF0DE|nr:BTB/POZ domain-containing protein 19-like [Ruditapes philippinarum]